MPKEEEEVSRSWRVHFYGREKHKKQMMTMIRLSPLKRSSALEDTIRDTDDGFIATWRQNRKKPSRGTAERFFSRVFGSTGDFKWWIEPEQEGDACASGEATQESAAPSTCPSREALEGSAEQKEETGCAMSRALDRRKELGVGKTIDPLIHYSGH